MNFFRQMFNNNKTKSKRSFNTPPHPAPALFSSLQENADYVQEALFHTEDLIQRSISYQLQKGSLLYLDSMCDKAKIFEMILKPLMQGSEGSLEDILVSIRVEKRTQLEQVIHDLIQGYAVLIFEGETECHVIQVNSTYNRDVNEPQNEKTVRGSHEGFIESLTVNLQLVRKQIQSTNLVVRTYKLGAITQTKTAVVYLNNLANPKLIEEIDRRLLAISADSVVSTNVIEEYIEEKSYSPFPQLLNTERPDRVVSNLLEGRAVLFTEGTPSALIMPVTFFAFFQSPDDYYSRSLAGSFIRVLRLLSLVITVALPAFYIAVVSFHYEVIPAELFYQIKGSVDQIPFPPILETLFMELTIELLREAGMRLPGPIGQTIGIVGGLVIGDAVVRVGLVSYPMIIVVALTAIASFVIPAHEMSASVRLLRFPVMFSAALLGFFGIVLSVTVILIHLCKLKSFGTPYLAPASPFRWKDWKDTLVRLPFWKLNERPMDAHPQKVVQETESREWQHNDRGRE
ncbi:spore germination protein [Paenibacillus radicis (ex Xue et al. 2023)]|uniref:Spore germination protein n=1 Tax=Paenibacillus radicis (ex Xue et al. 2023) TaxID=2972489 RepID=A0ABT1YUP5_9BACL|nr:spore germination protein [Paenibacillus radicis (ex Xue et al. 2023)]MCR8636463.1 spore germination protein [Paenibacillus radicis (ex Xue et al. 2023)]